MIRNNKKNIEQESEDTYLELVLSERQFKAVKYTGFIFLFIGLYLIMNSIDMFSSTVIDPNAGLVLILITGLLTSAHCVGMCSGFVVAYSTGDSETKISKKTRMRQHLLYNISRLGSYISFGILAGLVGALFMMTEQIRGYLSILAGVFMMLYGLSTFFPWLRRITTIRTPSLVKYTKNRGPVIFGLLNGLMPCGPLQAMLIYAASTGSAFQGGLTMFIFGIGTIPLMFVFGNAISFFSHNFTRKIMGISAIVVIALGLVTLDRGLLLSGYNLPIPSLTLFSPVESRSPITGAAVAAGDYQEINMKVDRYGWNPDTFYVKKGVPVKWNIYVEKLTYCFKGIRLPKYDLRADFAKEGENVTLQFTPEEEGTILFTCWMGMARGDIIVKEDLTQIEETDIKKEPGVAILKVRGMCCAGCERRIERRLLQIDGVKNADVSYVERKATINFDPAKTSVEEIISVIESSGRYDAEEL